MICRSSWPPDNSALMIGIRLCKKALSDSCINLLPLNHCGNCSRKLRKKMDVKKKHDISTSTKRIAINFGGGYVPGLNSVIAGAVLAAGKLGWETVGIRDGYDGLLFPE